MAKPSKPGESFLLSVVHKENAVSDPIKNEASTISDTVEDVANKAIQDISEQLKALREQVQALQASTADVAAQAGKVVATGARVAGDKIASGAREASDRVAEGARVAGDRAVAGAKLASEKVTSTVETYPISALLIASATAFLLGRLSASSFTQPSYTESTIDNLKHRLHDLSSRLPPNLKSAVRSSLR